MRVMTFEPWQLTESSIRHRAYELPAYLYQFVLLHSTHLLHPGIVDSTPKYNMHMESAI